MFYLPIFFIMINMEIIFFIFLSFFFNFYFGKKLKDWYFISYCLSRESKVAFVSTKQRSTRLKETGISLSLEILLLAIVYALLGLCGYMREWGSVKVFYSHVGMIIICSGFTFIRKPTNFEIRQITLNNNLNLGYGCVLGYYFNYLKKFALPNLLSRIRDFEGRELVQLPHKLFILCPFSCKVETYIDDKDYIERCRELQPLKKDYSGIPERVYNITVYQISHPEYSYSFRCALEYAQPLKMLMHFKEYGKMTSEEMFIERDLFCSGLNKLLRDDTDYCDKCELIQFDDEKTSIYRVLHENNSFKEYLN